MGVLSIQNVQGMDAESLQTLRELISIYNAHVSKNAEKNRYYEGHVTLAEVNLGFAMPNGMAKLEIGCEWGAKTVDVLAGRSMFDGFVASDGSAADSMMQIATDNHLIAEYQKMTRDELEYGCSFATLSADSKIGCRIRFHSPESASAIWDGQKGRIGAGLAIIDTRKDESDTAYRPRHVNMYTDTAVWELVEVDGTWFAECHPHEMGRPLMEPFTWNATSKKPFGKSRLKDSVRRLVQGFIRTVANATIGLEFATSPQKYLLGVTDEQYDQLINEKFRTYVGSILLATANPETGQIPNFGQLAQGSIEPHVQMLRMLATQFSAATGLSVTDTGVINDANPTSSDAILAQSQTLVSMAEQLNASNGESLKMVSMMALAIKENKTLEELEDAEKNIIAHFKNPAMPSVAVTADAAIKIASARPEFAETDTFLEMVGFDQADIRRIKAQEMRARGQAVLGEFES